MEKRISLGFVFGAVAINDVGVRDLYTGKNVYYVEGEFGPEVTTNILKAKIFKNEEEIKKLRFQNVLMSSGEINRGSFLYNCFGKSKNVNELFIKELFVEDSGTYKETSFIIRHDKEIDPEYQEYLILKEKFEK